MKLSDSTEGKLSEIPQIEVVFTKSAIREIENICVLEKTTRKKIGR